MEPYLRLLVELRDVLRENGVECWAAEMSRWVEELESPGVDLAAHLTRTRKAFGGMGSLQDVVFGPQQGDRLAALGQPARERYRVLLDELYEVVKNA